MKRHRQNEWIVDLLTTKGLSQADLARAMGIHTPLVSRLINGDYQPPMARLAGMSRFLEVPILEIFDRLGDGDLGYPAQTKTVIWQEPITDKPRPEFLGTIMSAWHNRKLAESVRDNPDQVTIIRVSKSGEFIYRAIGEGAVITRVFGREWREKAVGQLLAGAFPDQEYDDTTAQAYYRAAWEKAPQFDHVLACVARDDTGARKWLAYDRFIAPVGRDLILATRLVPPAEFFFPFHHPETET